MIKCTKIKPGAKVGVLGLGLTGKAATRYCLESGARVYVSDLRPKEQFLREEEEFLAAQDVMWEAGGHRFSFLSDMDLVLLSPGISPHISVIEKLVQAGVEVTGELAIAAGNLEVPVIAVTGTNGKTTVTTLIGEILKAAGKRVFVGGNIGTPMYEYLLHSEKYDALVLEVSSFQLECCGEFAPDVGLLLNVTPDHLDRHGSMDCYLAAKMQLFTHQHKEQYAIFNGDVPPDLSASESLAPQILFFGQGAGNQAIIDESRISISVDGRKIDYNYENFGSVKGVDRMNFAAAILACHYSDCSVRQIMMGLKNFRSLDHRLEFVGNVAGVSYYNDSKATNTGAVIGALNQFEGSVILIAGGRHKGDDFRLLRDAVAGRVRHVLLLGESAEMIEEALLDLSSMEKVETMEEAVVRAAALAVEGETVLLSPGCASFDMFDSYGHRGDLFKEAVTHLKTYRATSEKESAS